MRFQFLHLTITFNFPFESRRFERFIGGENLSVSSPRATLRKAGSIIYVCRFAARSGKGNNSATIAERRDLLSRLWHVAIYKLTFRTRVLPLAIPLRVNEPRMSAAKRERLRLRWWANVLSHSDRISENRLAYCVSENRLAYCMLVMLIRYLPTCVYPMSLKYSDYEIVRSLLAFVSRTAEAIDLYRVLSFLIRLSSSKKEMGCFLRKAWFINSDTNCDLPQIYQKVRCFYFTIETLKLYNRFCFSVPPCT